MTVCWQATTLRLHHREKHVCCDMHRNHSKRSSPTGICNPFTASADRHPPSPVVSGTLTSVLEPMMRRLRPSLDASGYTTARSSARAVFTSIASQKSPVRSWAGTLCVMAWRYTCCSCRSKTTAGHSRDIAATAVPCVDTSRQYHICGKQVLRTHIHMHRGSVLPIPAAVDLGGRRMFALFVQVGNRHT